MIPVKWPGLKAGMFPAVGPQPVKDNKEKVSRDESLSPKKKAPGTEDRGRSVVKKKLSEHNREGSRSFSDPSGRRWAAASAASSSSPLGSPDDGPAHRSNTVQDLVRTFEDLSGSKPGGGMGKRSGSANWRRPCNQYGEGIPLYEAMLSELRQAVGQAEQRETGQQPASLPTNLEDLQGSTLSYQQSQCYPVLMNELEGILEEWPDHQPPIKLPSRRVLLTGTALLVPRPFLGPYTQMHLGRRFSTGSIKQSRRTWRPYDKQTAC